MVKTTGPYCYPGMRAGGVTVSFFFSSRRRHTRDWRDWSSDVCSSDLEPGQDLLEVEQVVVTATGVAVRRDQPVPEPCGAGQRPPTLEVHPLTRPRRQAWWRSPTRRSCPCRLTRAASAAERRRRSWVAMLEEDRKSTRLNSSHANISHGVFCLKKKQ